ncbi:amidohydrolase family protein [Pedobacter cryotolerans]|uniref:Amidohydrolase n=1 Tax=Pedobacter cryotolerans TaxID=2571270 RepID=A0A4V5NYF4_9SPHI|nr:amidohydrolase family protein [Pedobacter cryotolerans]TKC03524.1 amidohydrolase [Pedobacter cryotolerans]
MQKFISANWIFPVTEPAMPNGVLEIDGEGKILQVLTQIEARSKGVTNIEFFEGALVPGFVNTHCHLELSHLYGKIPERTGLPAFVKEIVAQRTASDEVVLKAMELADEQMYTNGIVAVGDISNQLISKYIKQKSKLYYHTFVEVFGFNRPSEPIINDAIDLRNDFLPLKSSIVPHAPYSVSADLLKSIAIHTREIDLLSIHNQETAAENEFFEVGTGDFDLMYQRLNIPKSEVHGNGKNSLNYHLPKLPKNVNTLLVHNTFSSKADVDFAENQHQKLFWCLCPNANLYIENNLPDVDVLKSENVKITLGTDSLASNHQLSILSEMKTLQDHKNVHFADLLKWATLNGAEFLGIEQQYGSFEVGKKPGILNIDLDSTFKILNNKVKRVI